ncbi:MAG: HEAT repeat domain-containing protein, partial [Candidatus Muiribacteriota bacterium]
MNPEIDIFESMQELFEHPDLNVKIYILEEIINANISNDDKEEFLLTAINSDSVKLQEKAVSIFFDKIENPGAILVKSIISLMCVTHNIKLVDLIIDNISKFDNRKLISILKDYMTTHLPEFQKNIYFLLVKMDSEESFDLIVKALLDNQDKNSSNFYKDILSKKIKTLSENNLNINIYADKIQKILNQVSNFKIKQFFIRELLLLGEQAVLPFFDYYKNSVNREEIIDSLKPVNSQTLYSIFASKIHENENIDTEYFRMIVEIFSKINPEKIFDLISDNSLIGDNEEILVETLKNTRDFSLIVKMLSSGKKTLVLTGLKICEKFDNPSIHETIKKLLKNPDENVRLNAIKSLSRNSLSEMMPIYKEMLSDPSESVQNEILGILSKFN